MNNSKIHKSLIITLIILFILPSLAYSQHPIATSNQTATDSTDEWIAYTGRDYNIWLVHPDGTGSTQITFDGNSENPDNPYHELKWSPNGSRLSFLQGGYYGLPNRLWGYSLSEKNTQILVDEISGGFDWSSDGTTIVYSTPSDGLWLLDVTSGAKRYFAGKGLGNYLMSPQWSPDGNNILVFTGVERYQRDSVYMISTLDNSIIQGEYPATSCDWAPDGKGLACVVSSRTDAFGLFDTNLSVFKWIEYPPDIAPRTRWQNLLWSPDGKSIIANALTTRTEWSESFLYDLETNKPWQRIGFWILDWSPDSLYVLEDDYCGLITIDINTLSRVNLEYDMGRCMFLGFNGAWQPNSPLSTNISIQESDRFIINIQSPFSPETQNIEVLIRNEGNAPANKVRVELWSGDPDNGGIQIGSGKVVGPINPGKELPVNSPVWTIDGNVENQILYVRVNLEGQTDINPTNNYFSRIIDIYYTPYYYNSDTYSFQNDWKPDWAEAYNDLKAYIATYAPEDIEPNVMFPVVLPFVGLLLESQGYCIGMSYSSILYKAHSELIPPSNADEETVYSLTKGEALENIQHYQRQSINYIIDGIMVRFGFNAQLEYETVLYSIRDLNSPIMLLMYGGNFLGGSVHAVVAYKIVDLGDEKRIFVYDPNKSLAGPPTLQSSNYVSLNKNTLYYEGTNYDRFIARTPVLTLSDATLTLRRFYYWALQQIQNIGKIRIFLGSPVEPLITDQTGRRIGYLNGGLLNEIPEATLVELGDKKVFDLPISLTYTLSTTGTDTGTMALSFLIPLPDDTIRNIDYFSVPVTSGSVASLQFSQNNSDWTLDNSGSPSQQPDVNSLLDLSDPNDSNQTETEIKTSIDWRWWLGGGILLATCFGAILLLIIVFFVLKRKQKS